MKMKCPACNAELPSTAKFCGGCGTTLTAPSAQSGGVYPQPNPVLNAAPDYVGGYGVSTAPGVQKRYKLLRLIAVLMKILAIIGGMILIIGGLVMIAAGAASSSRSTTFNETGPAALFGGFLGGLIMLVYGIFVFVFLYAYAEWMYVFMDIEENTRLTNEMLSNRK